MIQLFLQAIKMFHLFQGKWKLWENISHETTFYLICSLTFAWMGN